MTREEIEQAAERVLAKASALEAVLLGYPAFDQMPNDIRLLAEAAKRLPIVERALDAAIADPYSGGDAEWYIAQAEREMKEQACNG